MIIATFILSVIIIALWIFIIIHYVRLGSKYGELARNYEKLCDSHEECIKKSIELESENYALQDKITFLRAKYNKNKEK
jgi:uncharacterized membrane protein